MSKLRSPRLVCSTTTGTRAASGSIMRISSFVVERRAENRRAGPSGALHRRQGGGFQGGNRAGRFGKRIAGQLRSVRGDRKSVVSGKRVSVLVDLGGRRIIKKTKTQININQGKTK